MSIPNVADTWHYWREMFGQAFWNSLMFFFETREGTWKGVGLILVGMVVTTAIVWLVRSREALTEHLKANIAIAIAGGVATWLLVFVVYVIREPFLTYQDVAGQLNISGERERAAVISKQTAELQAGEAVKHPLRITVQERCKLTAEQINPARLPQPCPGAPPPTLRDRVLAVNAHMTEGDRNRFSNALSEFEVSLKEGESLFYKINNEGTQLERDRQDGTIAKDVQSHQTALSNLEAEGWKYQKAFPGLRTKWDMFREQMEYIFGGNPDNEGPNVLLDVTIQYRGYLGMWNVIKNKDEKPILNLLGVEHTYFGSRMRDFSKWHGGCVQRLAEMRSSIR